MTNMLQLQVFKPGIHRPASISISLVSGNHFHADVGMLYVSACPPPRLLITSGKIWTLYDWLRFSAIYFSVFN